MTYDEYKTTEPEPWMEDVDRRNEEECARIFGARLAWIGYNWLKAWPYQKSFDDYVMNAMVEEYDAVQFFGHHNFRLRILNAAAEAWAAEHP